MTKLIRIGGGVVLLCGSGWLASGCGRAAAHELGREETRGDVQLMVYKQDFATIQETRSVNLEQGRNRIQLDHVSKQLDPNFLIFDWGKDSERVEIVSNTYDLGVGSGASLLSRLEGKQVDLLWPSQEGEPKDRLHGRLETSQYGGFVIRSDGKLYVNPNGTIVAPAEAGLTTMPTLSAEVQSKSAAAASLDITYQSRGMSWSADYVAKLDPTGDFFALECWATVENHTGIDFRNAKITLLAGSPNRAVRAPASLPAADAPEHENRSRKDKQSEAGFSMAPEAVGELYAYKVPLPASIGQEQLNRVKMIASAQVPIRKDYSIQLQPNEYAYGENPSIHQNAQLAIHWTNNDASGLGMPLPSGAVRVYDSNHGTAAYIGAASLGDTAKNQGVSLTLSKVFDVYSESRLVKVQKVDKKTVQRTFEAVLHNEKATPITLRLTQSLAGKKKMVSESVASRKLDANWVEWKILLRPGESKKLVYTANFAW